MFHLHPPFWGMRMPGAFHLIGASTGLEEYRILDAEAMESQEGFQLGKWSTDAGVLISKYI